MGSVVESGDHLAMSAMGGKEEAKVGKSRIPRI